VNVLGVVLAAGASTRLGRPKQSVVIAGRPLLGRAVDAIRRSKCRRVAVVLGSEADRLRDLVPSGITILYNDDWREGLASSVRVVVDHALGTAMPPDAILFTVCDQPALEATVLDRLIDSWTPSRPWAVAAGYAGTLGVPALFDRRAFDDLSALSGDRGARDLLRRDSSRVVVVDWPDGARDVDDPEDPDFRLSR
jgi:molybdenum cofactor cytidylyltransferase